MKLWWVLAGLAPTTAWAVPLVGLAAPDTVFAGQSLTVRVHVWDLPPGSVVGLYGNLRRGVGPCAPTGECGGLGRGAVALASRVATAPFEVVLPLPPTIRPGDTVHLQAFATAGGTVSAISVVVDVDVQLRVPGCTDATADNYDPAANDDDGSCVCPAQLAPVKAADLVQQLGCADFELLDLTGYEDPVFELPALVSLGELLVDGPGASFALSLPSLRVAGDVWLATAGRVDAVALPSLETAGRLVIGGAAGLTAVELPSLSSAGQLSLFAANLTDVDAPALVDAGTLSLGLGPAPTEVVLPALRAVDRLDVRGGGVTRIALPSATTVDVVLLGDVTSLATLELAPGAAVQHVSLRGDLAPALALDLDGLTGTVVISSPGTASDVTVSGARTLEAVVVSAVSGPVTLTLPDAEQIDFVGLTENCAGRFVFPRLVSVPDALDVSRNDHDLELEVPALARVGWLNIPDNEVLTRFAAPSLASVDVIFVAGNPELAVFDVPALTCDGWTGEFDDNPQLCVTTALPLGQAPGTCAAVGTGNSCDP